MGRLARQLAWLQLFSCFCACSPTKSDSTDSATTDPPLTAGSAGESKASAGTSAVPPRVPPDLRGGCAIKSGYADDHACIPAPDPSEGMQIHIGPSNYDDPDEVARYILKPGQETSQCWTYHTPNDRPVYYQTTVLSGRTGTHHIINTLFKVDMTDGGFVGCADGGAGINTNILDNLPIATKAYMPRGRVAAENAHIGRLIPPHTAAQADMHYFNLTEKDILREFWMNIYFVKEEQIDTQSTQIRGMGGISWNTNAIAPGTDKVYSYECPIVGKGRILSLLGHYHSHGRRFRASIRHASDGFVSKVFEMYDYLDPAAFDYDSVSQNAGFADGSAGAVSGVLDVEDGDVLMWDCHIVNDSDKALNYTNAVKTGEMCNVWGTSVGIEPINCLLD